jgi:patatin-like phospholipase/acyl hydrolase
VTTPKPTHNLRTDLKPRGRRFITILSLDGGGIRGLIPARIVETLERRTGLPACHLFDVIAGTSTGGIIALGLTRPSADPATPMYSAMELVDLYRKHGPKIFHRSLGHIVVTAGGLAGPKYSSDGIEAVLKDYFGKTRIREAMTSVLVTSYDTAEANPYFFKSYRASTSASGSLRDGDYLMWQAARATSAAPTYFPPFRLKPLDPSAADKSLLDGGVFANNPAMCAMADAYKLFRDFDMPVLVVSVGTGNDDLRLVYNDVKGRGLLRWAVPILKVVFDGVSDSVDYEAQEMADEYYRFQEDSVAEPLDGASPEAIQRLLAAADDLISRRDSDLTTVARILTDNLSPVAPVAVPGS